LHKAQQAPLKKLRPPTEMQSIRLIEQIFVRLQSTYGAKFSSQFKSGELLVAAMKEWAYALSPYTANDFGYAIREMHQHYAEWAPTLPQFIDLCKKHYKTMPMLESPKVEIASKSVGNDALAQMRASIGIRKNKVI